MEEYQLRIVIEKAELDIKIKKLDTFIGNTQFVNHLSMEEQYRLKRQVSIMCEYSAILGDRIAAF